MAEQNKPTTPPAAKPVEPAPAPVEKVIDVVLERDYWPKDVPADWPADQEYRVAAGETLSLPVKEALRVVSLHVGTLADVAAAAR